MKIKFNSLKENILYTESLNLPTKCFIDGKYQDSNSSPKYSVFNPYNGKLICEVTCASKKEVNIAVKNARDSFNKGVWRDLPPIKRKNILLKFADLLEKNFKELAFLKTLEMGKPIRYSATIDVKLCVSPLRYAAEAIDKIFGKVAPTPNHAIATITREPIGVVAAITPWNFPIMMSLWKYAPALALGNSVVLKPAEQTPFTSL